MHVETKEMEPRKAVCMAHSGAYQGIGATCGRLGAWIRETGAEVGIGICLYYDDPYTTPEADLRSDAGALVTGDFTTNDNRVHVVDVPGGKYAVTTHVGPYNTLSATWMEFMSTGIAATGYTPRHGPCFELYIDDCATTPVETLRTEVYAPVA